LSRIEKWAFQKTCLVEIILPTSVEVFGECCFSECRSLSSVTFESESRLLGNQMEVFGQAGYIGMAEYKTQLQQ
jgi:hypothetical protein